MMPDPGENMYYYQGSDGLYVLCSNCCCATAIVDPAIMAQQKLAFQHKCMPHLVGNKVVLIVGIEEWS